MYNFLKKAFHLSSEKSNENLKIEDKYLKSILFQAEKSNASEKTLKLIRDIVSAIAKKDKKTLREICSLSGIPEESPLLRSLLWKINLKFLDLNIENWADIIAKKRSEYNNMKEAFIIKMEIDRKMQEDSSNNNTNSEANIIRKNGDSINETEEESKDSSASKSKNNSKSKLSSNMVNSINALNINNDLKNLSNEENENKNNLDKNAKNQAKLKVNLNENSDIIYQSKSNLDNENNANSNFNAKTNSSIKDNKIGFEVLIAKNQSDFSRNFLNLELDERKIKKNKKNIFTNHKEIYKDFSRLEDNFLNDQAEIRKTFDNEKHEILKNKDFSFANITFENEADYVNDVKLIKTEKPIKQQPEKDSDFLKKLNLEKKFKNASNNNHSKIPLPIKFNVNNDKAHKEDINGRKNLNVNDKNYISNNNQNFQSDFVKGNFTNNNALTPQIKLNRNERETSTENKNRNKIDFNFSVIDFLNKNISRNSDNKIYNNNNAISNTLTDNANNVSKNKNEINKFFNENNNKDKTSSLKFLSINNSSTNNNLNINNPGEEINQNCEKNINNKEKTYKIKTISIQHNKKGDLKNNDNIKINDCINENKQGSRNILSNKVIQNSDLKNNVEEKKQSNAKSSKQPKANKISNKTLPDPLLDNIRKNSKIANYEDKALIEEIYKDMKRTHCQFQFLLTPCKAKEDILSNFHLEKILKMPKNKKDSTNEEAFEEGFQPETHLDAVARILYTFAKLNKNIRYVQGMNELAALIYFVIMQEEQLEKISVLMEKNKLNDHNDGKFNKNNIDTNNNKEYNLNFADEKKNNLNQQNKINKPYEAGTKDKQKLNLNFLNNKNKDNRQKLDVSSSINASIKICDLARLEEGEEEKNFFDLNLEKKIENFEIKLPEKFNHSKENSNNKHLHSNVIMNNNNNNNNFNKQDNNLIKSNYQNNQNNQKIKEFNNLNYIESLNDHEELFGLNSNRLIKNPNEALIINDTTIKSNYNKFKFDIANQNKDKINRNEIEKEEPYIEASASKLNNQKNIFFTPDISKEKAMSKLNLNEISSKATNINNLYLNFNNQINNNYNNNNFDLIDVDTITKSKIQGNLTAEKKNPNCNFNTKPNSQSNLCADKDAIQTDIEADTFWCFCYLMDQLKHIYLRSEDNKEKGIMKKIDNLKNLLKIIDKSLFAHLEAVSVDITLFGFKWIVLLFAQNFLMKDALKIWDLILFVEHPTDIFYKVYYFALAVFEYKRTKILGSDFPGVVLQMQNLNDINVDILIGLYRKIIKDNGKKIKKALGY